MSLRGVKGLLRRGEIPSFAKDEKEDKTSKKHKDEKKEKEPKAVPPLPASAAEDAGQAEEGSVELLNPEFLELFTRAAPLKIEEKKALVLPIISPKEAEIWLDDQPDGSSLLRLEEAALPTRHSPIVLSYKYQHLAFHHTVEERVAGSVKMKEKDKGAGNAAGAPLRSSLPG